MSVWSSRTSQATIVLVLSTGRVVECDPPAVRPVSGSLRVMVRLVRARARAHLWGPLRGFALFREHGGNRVSRRIHGG